MLWDLATSRRLATFNGHKNTIWSLDFSADGSMLASGSSDQTVRLWDVSGKKKIDLDDEERDKNA
jgi:transcription initiation factor TFIID subunit 5